MNKAVRKITPFGVFVAINAIGFLMFFTYALKKGGVVSDWLLMENQDLGFCDFSMHLNFVANRPALYYRARGYEGCFPPLSYIMYYFFYKLLFRAEVQPSTVYDIIHLPYFHLITLYYSMFVAFIMLYGVKLYGDKDKKKNIVLFITLIMSVPFMAGAFFVANSTLLVMALLVVAIKLRESDDKVNREIALILIAICAGFKIYPAVFGLLYLLEKRFGEAIRLTIYGIVLFFAPFSIFGGVTGFKLWLGNVVSTMGLDQFGRIQSIRGLFYSSMQHFGIEGGEIVLKLAPILFFFLMLVLACVTASKYKRMFFVCAIMVFFPNNAYRYTLCYLAIPIIIYFLDGEEEEDAGKFIPCLEMAIYACVFTIPMLFGFATDFELTFPYYTLTYVELYIYIWAYILLIFVTVKELILIAVRKKKS